MHKIYCVKKKIKRKQRRKIMMIELHSQKMCLSNPIRIMFNQVGPDKLKTHPKGKMAVLISFVLYIITK